MQVVYQLIITSTQRKVEPGRCVGCGCTQEFGCDGGCDWADDRHTLCTACLPGSSARLDVGADKLKFKIRKVPGQ